jgi:phosphatidylglycerophosphatase A
LLALLLGALLMRAPTPVLPLAALAATIGGVWAIRAAMVDGDPGWVVIDEVAGQWIALLGLARPAWPGLLAAFVLFRLLDIAKPGPIGWADRQRGAVGVMADDVIAGAVAAAILYGARLVWPSVLG